MFAFFQNSDIILRPGENKMVKKDTFISKSRIDQKLKSAGISRGHKYVRDYYSNGMNASLPCVPTEVISWVTTHNLVREGKKCHSRHVLKIPLNGKNTTYLDGQVFRLAPGNALMIFPFQVHSNAMIRPGEKVCEMLIVTFDLSGPGVEKLDVLKKRVLTISEQDETLLFRIIAAYQGIGNAGENGAVFALSEFLSNQIDKISDSPQPEHPSDRLTEICAFMKRNYASNISVKTLAEEFSITASTVRRIFRRCYGGDITPGHFLTAIRLQHASGLLIHSGDSIAKIAHACGYRDQFGFSRAFHHATGLSPLAYRKKYGN